MRCVQILVIVGVTAAALAGGEAAAETRRGEATPAASLCSLPPQAEASSVGRAASQRHDAGSGVRFWAGMDGQGRAVLRLTAAQFEFEKSVTAAGQTDIRIVGGGDRVTVSFAEHIVSVGRGRASVKFDPRLATEEDENKVRRLLVGSRAVRVFRAIAAHLESRSPEEDDFFALATLVDGALVGLLDGDKAGVARVAKRIGNRQRARLQSVAARLRGQFPDCVGMYESTVSWAWNEYSECTEEASDDSWLIRSINTNFCTTEWILRAESAAFQFLACAALPT